MTLQCRTCGSVIYNKNALNIFEFEQLEILKNIEMVVGTALTNDPELPVHTCGCCLLDLKRAIFHINVFRERYLKAQKQLQLETAWESDYKINEVENNLGKEQVNFASDEYFEKSSDLDEELIGFQDVCEENAETLISSSAHNSESEKSAAEFENISIKEDSAHENELDSNSNSSNLNETAATIKSETEKVKQIKVKVKKKRYSSWKNLTEAQVIERKRQQRRRDCICDQCGRHFTDQSNFKLHMIRHSGIKNFECKVCEKRFYTEHLLQLHERIVHQGERPYACRYCERRFQNSTSRIVHERGHNNVRPYCCKFCEKTFTYSTGLSRHLLIHNGARPYFCTVCDRNFQRNTHLKAHLRSKQHAVKQANESLLRVTD